MIWILLILVSIILIFRFTTVWQAIVLQIWNTKNDREGIVHPFLKLVVYESKNGEVANSIQKHEQTHLKQINRLGSLKFCYLYVWYLMWYGYKDNPLEVEARNAEQQI